MKHYKINNVLFSFINNGNKNVNDFVFQGNTNIVFFIKDNKRHNLKNAAYFAYLGKKLLYKGYCLNDDCYYHLDDSGDSDDLCRIYMSFKSKEEWRKYCKLLIFA